MSQDTTNATNDGCYIGLSRNTQENIMDTNEPAINLDIENTLDVVDSLRHLIYDTRTSQDIRAAQGLLLEIGEELYGEHPKSRDVVDQHKRTFGAYLLLQALRKTPGVMDTMLEVLQARVVAHLRPDLLRVFDEAHAPLA